MEKEGKRRKKKDKIYNIIVQRIDTRLTELGLSRPKLVERTGIAKNALAQWAVRETIPAADVALAIADELQCSVRWLVTGEDDVQEEYSVEEKIIISKFRNLDKQGQFEVKALLDAKTVPVGKETIPDIVTAAEKKQAAG